MSSPHTPESAAPGAYWVAGKPVRHGAPTEIRNPYDGSVAGVVYHVDEQDIEAAVAAAEAARRPAAQLSAHARAEALAHLARRLGERADEVARLITAESGKPVKWARGEVTRAISTFRWAAEEARRFSGTLQRLDTDPDPVSRLALVRRVPRGPVLGITPFNFPLNLVAHKVAPAIAVGAPIVLKPAPSTPLTALLLGELLAETDLPEGTWSVLPMSNESAAHLVADPRLPVVSFTGSATVGWQIRDRVPRKHVTLELGGNAGVLVCRDWHDLETAAQRIALLANAQGGQSCIAVQRVFAEAKIYPELVEAVVRHTAALKVGNPFDLETDVGPLINEAAARRVESCLAAAVQAGATVLTGGERVGAVVQPTVLADAPADSDVQREEIFGPVMTVTPVSSAADGLARINDSRYGLQAGVFTNDVRLAFRAAAELDVGGVIIGDVPTYRADQMPYGGVKDSGAGREGVHAAMVDLTDERVLVLTGVQP
ncbi:MAG TPA: aldehyde dehydrogenase family protein [Micromonosporaceae bacterium]|nr:aldehyde dehydrogenase family protein [Micromonosporaceae bacterium]